MATTTITSATGRNSGEDTFVDGIGPPHTYVFLTKDGHGGRFGLGQADARGRFHILVGKLPPDIYDWVTCEASADGVVDESKGYSNKVRQIVDAI